MKRLILILIALLLPAFCLAGSITEKHKAVIARKNAATAGPSYLVEEDCEGTGTPAGWVDTSTPNWDNVAVVLRGTQSVALDSNNEYTTKTFTGQGTVNVFFRFQLTDMPASYVTIFKILDSTPATVLSLRVYSTGAIRIYHGTINASSGAGVIAADTTYYVWITYTKDPGGGNGVASVTVETSAIKGTADASIANGDATTDADRIRMEKDNTDGYTHYYDQILVDDEVIGDVPA